MIMGKRTFSWPHLEIFTPNTQRGITLELHLLLGTLFPSGISNKLVGISQCGGYSGGKNSEDVPGGTNHESIRIIGITR